MDVHERRHQRSRDIIAATRALFDERGMRDAQIEDIATAVGINRAIIYRHFQTKEELFAMTLVEYLDELNEILAKVPISDDPAADLEAQAVALLNYGRQHPAFVDCAQALLRYRGSQLLQDVSLSRMTELGSSISENFSHMRRTIERGNDAGLFDVPDPELLVNILYTQGFGVLNLVTFQRSIREANAGLPVLDDLSFDTVVAYATRAMVALARPLD